MQAPRWSPPSPRFQNMANYLSIDTRPWRAFGTPRKTVKWRHKCMTYCSFGLIHINLIAEYNKREMIRVLRAGLNQKFIAPWIKRFETFRVVHIENQDAAVCATIKGHTKWLKTFLAGSIPYLKHQISSPSKVFLTCIVTDFSSTFTSFVMKSAPIVALYRLLNFLFTYWFIRDVLPTLQCGLKWLLKN